MQETNHHLQGQLIEKHRIEEMNRKELDIARQQKFAADVEKKKSEEKCLEAHEKLEEGKKQLCEVEVCEVRLLYSNGGRSV